VKAQTVLISGAGIAGPALAFWLKRAGFEPAIVEHAPHLRSGGYVVDFWGLGYDIAERMGLRPAVESAGYHAREMRIVGDDGRRRAGFGISVFDELTNGRYVTLARSELSRLMFGRLDGSVDVMFGNEIVSLAERNDGVDVEFARGPARRFDLVVGADGLHSAVRRLAFGPQQQFETQLGYAVAAFEADGYRPRDPDVYVMYGRPGRMIGRFTLRNDRTLFLFVFTADTASLPDMLAGRKAYLRARFDGDKWECPQILAALEEVDDLYFDRVSQIRMPTWSKGRIALVGDAAFCVSLLAGQGTALAMTAAYVLAGELAAADRHDDAFAAYEHRLRAFIAGKQKGARGFAGAFAPKTEFGLWFRNIVVKALNIPGAARLLFGRSIVDTLVLPEYDWAKPVPRGAPVNARS
jgi:2-polyprenyl-6-methoxyphenol hydroxylase-like FAD-dependent oxidoreductase